MLERPRYSDGFSNEDEDEEHVDVENAGAGIEPGEEEEGKRTLNPILRIRGLGVLLRSSKTNRMRLTFASFFCGLISAQSRVEVQSVAVLDGQSESCFE